MNNIIIQLLNLEDVKEKIETIDSEKIDNILYYTIKLKVNKVPCTLCSNDYISVHGYNVKKIVHSSNTVTNSYIKYKARRYKCKICNHTFFEENPFTFRNERVSILTSYAILRDLKAPNESFSNVAKRYNVSTTTASKIFDQYIDVSPGKPTRIMCFDETHIMSDYAFVLVDFISKEIIDVYRKRNKAYIGKIFTNFNKELRDNVDYIIIDMWVPYLQLAQIYFKNARIAVDSFHVIKNLNYAIGVIRKRVMNKYRINDKRLFQNDMYYYMLKKFHYFFTKDFAYIYSGYIKIGKIRSKWDKHEILKYLLSIDHDLKSAYELKEDYREFNLTADLDNTWNDKYDALVIRFLNHPIREMRDCGRLLETWKDYIRNSFVRIGNRRLSNGPIESINSRIKKLIKVSNGFKNFTRLRNRIIYSINKDTPIQGVPEVIVTKRKN